MERIESLISKLKDQFESKADSNLLLGTVQLLEFELTKLKIGNQPSLGTAKVAVMLPGDRIVGTFASTYEKYAPKPVEKLVRVIQETVMAEDGHLSVVQKNGQLDMLFDPMTEIPTLSNQVKEVKEKEVNNATTLSESLNDKLKQGKTELIEVLKESPVKDLRKAVGINDRFLLINELFRGDENLYERSIKTINSFNIYAEAEFWISRELKLKLEWDSELPTVKYFDQLVKRRFS
jgi:hypothetical protein